MMQKMKRRGYRLAACLAIVLGTGCVASCDSEDEAGGDVNVSAGQLVGTWQLTQEKGWTLIGGDKDEYTEDVSAQNRVYEFRSDGTLVDRRNNSTGSWFLSGTQLVMGGESSYITSFSSSRFVTEYYTDAEYKQSTYQRVN